MSLLLYQLELSFLIFISKMLHLSYLIEWLSHLNYNYYLYYKYIVNLNNLPRSTRHDCEIYLLTVFINISRHIEILSLIY
jgi:hypothetical protein